MLNCLFFTGLVACATVGTSVLAKAAIASPQTMPSVPKAGTAAPVEMNAPICYIQFQGGSAIDVSRVCGKAPGEAPASASTVAVSNASTPPVFDPNVTNASTTGQCNFVDASGNPCPQK
ncbi:MAG: hypothetical protein KME27_11680 [Lyngbya sp. HA4199-MV5]|nr:hypothetical protein [Lyngbya sp. HA4199-MV5]